MFLGERMNNRMRWLGIGLLLAAVVALYGRFLSNPLVFDDLYFFMQGQDGYRQHVGSVFAPWELRWLPYATLAWTADGFGVGLAPFRWGNLLLHAANAALLFLLTARLLQSSRPVEQSPVGDERRAWLVALLFALNPVSVYAAAYLIQRSILLATWFSLLALYAYLRGVADGRRRWLAVSVAAYALAVLSKEHLILLPAVMLALTFVLTRPTWALWRQLGGVYLACAGVATYVVAQRFGYLGTVYELDAPAMLVELPGDHPYLNSVLTQCALFFKYGALWLLPNPGWLAVDMREPFASGLLSRYSLAVLAFAAYGGAAIWLLRQGGRRALIGFGLLLPWLLFLTELSTVRIQEVFVLYRSYPWAIGGALVLAALIGAVRGRVLVLLSLALIPCLYVLSLERLATFSHPVLLWEDAEQHLRGHSDLPGAYRIYYNLGTERLKLDMNAQAVVDLRRSLELYPGLSAAHGNLALAYLRQEQAEAAVAEYTQALALDQKNQAAPNAKFYYGRGLAYQAARRAPEADADFAESCRLVGKGCTPDDRALPKLHY